MSEERRCYMNSDSETNLQLCGGKCRFFENGLACPFRTPREFWDMNLCDGCKNKSDKCRFLEKVVRNRRTGFVVGCFGFEEKEKEK